MTAAAAAAAAAAAHYNRRLFTRSGADVGPVGAAAAATCIPQRSRIPEINVGQEEREEEGDVYWEALPVAEQVFMTLCLEFAVGVILHPCMG